MLVLELCLLGFLGSPVLPTAYSCTRIGQLKRCSETLHGNDTGPVIRLPTWFSLVGLLVWWFLSTTLRQATLHCKKRATYCLHVVG